ncbi:hypothetical protein VB776_10125 [Arcicella sp. DC2W]|uniref:DoxX family protein n=1 Tax=Arcicella gelida TaxID=2984195 RepID=A0ABU5S452_9BACT|nr:hypothetical protein [Arcicella sp. DC2W]MEA5403272.1 hypothetical protein [Arcicella sp. DC2W]
MKPNKIFKTTLIWLPSLLVASFFIQNSFEKIFHSNEISKLSLNSTSIMLVGIFLLISTALFLIEKTLIIGTVILASYMTFVVFVHISKGKPFLLTVLIVVGIIFAAYLRKAQFFSKE